MVAKVNNEVDSTEVFTTKDEEQGANMAQLYDNSESVDSQEYYSDEQSNHGGDANKYIPPTPPKSRNGEGALRIVIDEDEEMIPLMM